MIEQMLKGFLSIFDPHVLPYIFMGIPAGLIVGFLPGLSGVTALAILMPLIYGMEPVKGLSFLLAAHSVCYTGGSVTAVLLNIPGTTPNAATILDGFPMTQKGMAGRAVGNALAASGLGGWVGGVALVGLIFIVRPIVMAFGLPEYFFLIFLGLCFIAVLGSDSPVKGFISGAVGIFLSFVGISTLTGDPRFTFGSIRLLDGFRIVPIGLGVFAMPEVVDLLTKKSGTIAKVEKASVSPGQLWEGTKDIFRHFWLFIISSTIGTFIGVVPGVGGDVAPWVAYGVAKQTSKNPEKFGTGCVEGVIAPEASNNAKEGGSLLPTLAFGIPGSAGMALLLGAFLIVGLDPGPMFLEQHLDLAFSMASTVMFANLVGAAVMMLIAGKLTAVSFIRGSILGPIILILVVFGAFCAKNDLMDIVFMFGFGALGVIMKAYHYNRAALFLGFVLGVMAEKYFGLSVSTYGPLFFLRPLSLAIIATTIVVLFYNKIRVVLSGKKYEVKTTTP
jgi:putative tricarboxylic transport membrane protein